MAVSQNGWTANDVNLTQNYTIGNGRQIRLRKGDAGFLLKHFADWFDAKIEDIDAGQLDDWGYAERPIRDGVELSNHASGTAMDLNATKHPLGARGTFPAAKASAIRQRLALYNGAIRWGGDYVNRADEMHFEINADAATVKRVADKIRSQATPKPVAAPARVPTISDIVVTLGRLRDRSANPEAIDRYNDAIASLGDIESGTRIKVPASVAEARAALRTKLASGSLNKEQTDRIESALNLLNGI